MTKTISITDAVVDYADVEKDVRCYLRRSELRATLRLNALNGTRPSTRPQILSSVPSDRDS
jgi:hypothetical protein